MLQDQEVQCLQLDQAILELTLDLLILIITAQVEIQEHTEALVLLTIDQLVLPTIEAIFLQAELHLMVLLLQECLHHLEIQILELLALQVEVQVAELALEVREAAEAVSPVDHHPEEEGEINSPFFLTKMSQFITPSVIYKTNY